MTVVSKISVNITLISLDCSRGGPRFHSIMMSLQCVGLPIDGCAKEDTDELVRQGIKRTEVDMIDVIEHIDKSVAEDTLRIQKVNVSEHFVNYWDVRASNLGNVPQGTRARWTQFERNDTTWIMHLFSARSTGQGRQLSRGSIRRKYLRNSTCFHRQEHVEQLFTCFMCFKVVAIFFDDIRLICLSEVQFHWMRQGQWGHEFLISQLCARGSHLRFAEHGLLPSSRVRTWTKFLTLRNRTFSICPSLCSKNSVKCHLLQDSSLLSIATSPDEE